MLRRGGSARVVTRGPITALAVMLGVILALVAGVVAAVTFMNGFETDTTGWLNNSGTANRVADGYTSPAPYPGGTLPAPVPTDPGPPRHHARLRRGACSPQAGGGGPTVDCSGPFTRWEGYNTAWQGGYSTQVDIYLDVDYAKKLSRTDEAQVATEPDE